MQCQVLIYWNVPHKFMHTDRHMLNAPRKSQEGALFETLIIFRETLKEVGRDVSSFIEEVACPLARNCLQSSV